MLFLAGAARAEPAGMPSVPAGAGASGADGEVWGDPEQHEEPQPGWTWFGMGYERRSDVSRTGTDNTGETRNTATPTGGGREGR
jgi:hypothetical protein